MAFDCGEAEMNLNRSAVLLPALLLVLACSACVPQPIGSSTADTVPPSEYLATITLPEPRLESEVSIEEALLQRRSIREYADVPLTLDEVSQLLWAAQGITAEWGSRTAPSAGALYPLEVYLVVGDVGGLATGVYKYKPEGHELLRISDLDVREELAIAAWGQNWVEEGAIDIVIAAVYERATKKYGSRGERYVHMEAGHAAQNIYLQAVALDLGMVTVGAFNDKWVRNLLGMPQNEVPLYVIPVGRKI